LYAAVTSLCACSATASAAWLVPITIPGGKPVTALPGLTPRSPVTTVGPVLVAVEPARTAKLAAVPRGGAVASRGRAQASPTLAKSTVAKSSTARVNKVVALVGGCFTCAPKKRPRTCLAKKRLIGLKTYPGSWLCLFMLSLLSHSMTCSCIVVCAPTPCSKACPALRRFWNSGSSS